MHPLSQIIAVAILTTLPVHARAGVFDCTGDCNANRAVTVDELITAVSIALGERPLGDCAAADASADGSVTVDEILVAVNAALVGCPAPGELAEGIQFIPESSDIAGDRSLLLRVGNELIFNDGSETPIQALDLTTRHIRPLVRHMSIPIGIAVRGDFAYWTESRNGIAPSGCVGTGVLRYLQRTSLSQRTTTQLARVDACSDTTGDVVLSATHAYWVASTVSPPHFMLMRTPLGGGTSEVVYASSDTFMKLAGDATHVYWMHRPNGPEANTQVLRMAFAGGSPEIVVDGLPMLIEPQGAFGLGEGVVVVARPLPEGGWDLLSVPATGGDESVLARLDVPPTAVTVHLGKALWTDATALHAVALGGGPVETLVRDLAGPLRLEPLADGVVWSETICCAHAQKGNVRAWRGDGTVVDVAVGVDAPGPLAVDGTRVYWGEGGPIGSVEGFGRIVERDIGGGDERVLASGSSVTLPVMASDGVYVYYVDRFRIERVDLHGGLPETWVQQEFYVDAVATDATRLFWLVAPFGDLRSMPLAGGPVTTLAAGSGMAQRLRVANGFAYWGEGSATIRRVPIDGGSVETVVTDVGFLSDLAVDGDTVYFTEQDRGAVRRVRVGAAPEVFGSFMTYSWSVLALNGGAAYWLDQEKLYRRGKSADVPRVIVDGIRTPSFPLPGIIADEEAVYWTEVGEGRIRAHVP